MVAIPEHLRHLRTDRRGLPVPYVNRWGLTEDVDKVAVRYDVVIRQAAVFYTEDPAETVPDFTRQCFQRQRECMWRRLCQVCARRLDWGETLLPLSTISVRTVMVGRSQVPVVTEPWLCPDDAAFAVSTCPALIRRRTADDLVLVQITAEEQVQMVVSRGYVDGPYKQSTKNRPVAMWCKAHLLVPTGDAVVPIRG